MVTKSANLFMTRAVNHPKAGIIRIDRWLLKVENGSNNERCRSYGINPKQHAREAINIKGVNTVPVKKGQEQGQWRKPVCLVADLKLQFDRCY
jgi:hypothetical protein